MVAVGFGVALVFGLVWFIRPSLLSTRALLDDGTSLVLVLEPGETAVLSMNKLAPSENKPESPLLGALMYIERIDLDLVLVTLVTKNNSVNKIAQLRGRFDRQRVESDVADCIEDDETVRQENGLYTPGDCVLQLEFAVTQEEQESFFSRFRFAAQPLVTTPTEPIRQLSSAYYYENTRGLRRRVNFRSFGIRFEDPPVVIGEDFDGEESSNAGTNISDEDFLFNDF